MYCIVKIIETCIGHIDKIIDTCIGHIDKLSIQVSGTILVGSASAPALHRRDPRYLLENRRKLFLSLTAI